MSTRQRVEGADRLVGRWKSAQPRRWRVRPAIAVVAALALVAAGVGAYDHYATRALSFALEGGHVEHGGVIEADPGAEPRLHFSDGSDIALSRGAQASLRRVDGQGATVSLTGSAYVDITHRPGARWTFEAGPFVIAVKGTAFRLGWNAAQEELDVRMDRGSIEVSGPLSDGALAMHSGQHLVVRVRQREMLLRDRDDGSPPPRPPEVATASANLPAASAEAPGSAPAASVPPTLPPRPVSSGSDADWTGLLAGGEFDAIVRQAERRGMGETIATSSSSDLAALADAARYSRRDGIARLALTAQRRRFPGYPAARDAAFLLGRLEETVRNASTAIDWYGRYMREDPNGTYASEALGRKMILIQQVSGDAQARAAATEYVSRFPGGPYSARAQALTRTP
jgi:hypothetical protein